MLEVEYFHIFHQSDEILHIFVEPKWSILKKGVMGMYAMCEAKLKKI